MNVHVEQFGINNNVYVQHAMIKVNALTVLNSSILRPVSAHVFHNAVMQGIHGITRLVLVIKVFALNKPLCAIGYLLSRFGQLI